MARNTSLPKSVRRPSTSSVSFDSSPRTSARPVLHSPSTPGESEPGCDLDCAFSALAIWFTLTPMLFASDAIRSASAFLVTTYVGSTSPPCTFSTQLRRNAERVIFFSEQIASSAASSSSENRTWTVRSLFGFLAA